MQGLPSVTHLAEAEAFQSSELEVVDEAYRHLFRSRRLAVGAEMRIVDGRGSARRGRVVAIDKRRARIELGDPLPSLEPELRAHLYVGALRPERADWLVEKATELGVATITFVAAERTPRQYGNGRLARQRRVAVAALEQCRRSRLPEIHGVLPWDQAVARSTVPYLLVLDGDGAETLCHQDLGGAGEVAVWVGPEGGLTANEVDTLVAQGARRVRLGPTVLRVETAALAALAALLTC